MSETQIEVDRFRSISVNHVTRSYNNHHWDRTWHIVTYDAPDGSRHRLSTPTEAPKNLKSYAKSIIKQVIKRRQARIEVLRKDIANLETEVVRLLEVQKDVNVV